MSEAPRSRRFARLAEAVEQDACWSGGRARPWEGEAMVSPELLQALLALASRASEAEVTEFIDAWKETQ